MNVMRYYGIKNEKFERLQGKKSTTKMEVDKRQVQLAGEVVTYISIHSGEV